MVFVMGFRGNSCLSAVYLRCVAAVILAATLISPALSAPVPRIKPPAPGPQHISRLDLEKLRAIQSDIKKRNFSRAIAASTGLSDPIARSLAEWLYFYGEDPKVSVTQADRFLDLHPEWPSLKRIQSHVERQMPTTTPPDQVLAFFDSRDPITSDGKVQLTRAMLARGDREVAERHLRDAWANDSFSLADERTVLSKYASLLRPEDHAARVDRLLWSRQVTAARRLFPKLTAGERRIAQARAALLTAASTGPKLYNSLSDAARDDSGVKLAAVRYYRRKGEEPRAAAIARTASTDATTLRNPKRWWSERQLLMRWALTNRIYSDAYAMAAGHGLEPGSTDFSEAEFNAGWIALRYLGEAERAKIHFAALTASVGAPISLARGRYWMARAFEAMGDQAQASVHYQLAASYPYTYYGQLAAEQIGGPALEQAFQTSPPPTQQDQALFNARPAVEALKMITDLGDARIFLIFSYHIDDLLDRSGEYSALAELTAQMDAPHVSVRAGKVSVRRDAFAPEVSYPLIFVPDAARQFVPEEVILGISRQESEFNPRAYSRAGARGLMQLIPSTAKITARKERLPYRQSALLDDPIYNMTLGAAHLSHLFERFDGSWLMTFAAYNAGAGRVNQWIDRYGDPRASNADPVDWIENIPFAETRNYVQRVMENAQVYRSRISGAPLSGALGRDLERGGARNRVGTITGTPSIGNLIALQARIAAIAEPILSPPSPAPAPDFDPISAAEVSDEPDGLPRAINRQPGSQPGSSEPLPIAVPNIDDTYEAITPPSIQTTLDPPATPPPLRDPEWATPTPSVINETPLNDSYINDGQLPTLTPETTSRPTFSDPDNTALYEQPGDNPPRHSDCITYKEFLTETEGENASAADLNAGSLAELQTGGGC